MYRKLKTLVWFLWVPSFAFSASFERGMDGKLTLFADRGENVTYDAALSGGDEVVKTGEGTVTLTGDNSAFTGKITVKAGTLTGSSEKGFGKNGDLVIENGGAIQITGNEKTSLNTRHVYVEGAGPSGEGAIIRPSSGTSGNGDAIFKDITLTGDATVNSGRRYGARAGTLDLAGYKLTKVGSAEFLLTEEDVKGGVIDTGTAGTFTLQVTGSELTDGASDSELLLKGTAKLSMWALDRNRASTWTIKTTGTPSISMGSSTATWSGPILNGGTSLTFAGNANTCGRFQGEISGTGKVVVNASGEIVLSGTNTYSGSTELKAGTLVVSSTNALPRFAEAGGVKVTGGKLVLDPAGWSRYDVERLMSSITKAGGSVVRPCPVVMKVEAPRVGRPLEMPSAEGAFGVLKFRWYRGTAAKSYGSTAIGTDAVYTPTTDDYEHWIKCVVEDELCELGAVEFFVSKLPVVYMTTDDGKTPTAQKEGHAGHIRIQGNDAWGLQYDGALDKVSVRGNSTASLPKKPYKIKLGKKTALFGIPKSKHWVLLANYYDESNMRNKIAYDLSGEMGLTQMRSTWVDVVLNGEWLGLYQLCEHIRVDSERVDVYNWEDAAEELATAFSKKYGLSSDDEDALIEKLQQDYSWVTSDSVSFGGWVDTPSTLWKDYSNDITGGYLFELSDEYDELSQFTVAVGSKLKVKTMLNAPEYLFSNASMMDYCKKQWQDYWNACTSATGYNSNGRHYSELSDVDSMVAYWLTMEVMGNNDASYKSRYAYKDRGGKLIWGPAWDFDWGIGGPVLRTSVTDPDTGKKYWAPCDATGWKVSKSSKEAAFYREWMDDPWFCLKVYEKYWAMRSRYEAIVETGGLIDQYATYLAEAGVANEAKWKYRIGFGGDDGDVSGLKTYLSDRLEWLDGQFATLETLMSSLKTTYSASPYAKDDDSLAIASSAINSNLVCSTDYFVPDGTDLSFTLTMKSAAATRVDAYLDGLKYGEAAVADGVSVMSIPANDLAQTSGGRRMIQFVAVNAGGTVLARNFATVLLGAKSEDPEPPEVDNVFLPTGTGENWDSDENWARGYYPNAPGERALIGVPTAVKKNKGYRTIHIAEHSVTVGVVEVTNGGLTNRIDNDIGGDLVFDGGADVARLVVTDVGNPGLMMLDLSDRVVLGSDLVCSVSNVVGAADYGGLLIKGSIIGNGKNLKKNGPGRMTITATAVEDKDVIAKLQIEEGTVAIASPLHVGSITKEGTVWLELGGSDLSTALSNAVICDDKISVDHVSLFAPTEEGGRVFYGGAVAKTVIGKSTTVAVYVQCKTGAVIWNGTKWKECPEATATAFVCDDGRQTYRVEVPVLTEGNVIEPSAGVKNIEVVASTPEQAIAQIDFAPPVDDGGQPVVSSAEYASYFTVSAVEGSVPGTYFVSAELNAEKLQPELNQALEDAFSGASVFSTIGSSDTTELTIETRPGLYYSMQSTDSLQKPFAEGERKLATGSSVILEVPAMGSCGFYKINVSAAPGLGD